MGFEALLDRPCRRAVSVPLRPPTQIQFLFCNRKRASIEVISAYFAWSLSIQGSGEKTGRLFLGGGIHLFVNVSLSLLAFPLLNYTHKSSLANFNWLLPSNPAYLLGKFCQLACVWRTQRSAFSSGEKKKNLCRIWGSEKANALKPGPFMGNLPPRLGSLSGHVPSAFHFLATQQQPLNGARKAHAGLLSSLALGRTCFEGSRSDRETCSSGLQI